jgi:hypothetical protein
MERVDFPYLEGSSKSGIAKFDLEPEQRVPQRGI